MPQPNARKRRHNDHVLIVVNKLRFRRSTPCLSL